MTTVHVKLLNGSVGWGVGSLVAVPDRGDTIREHGGSVLLVRDREWSTSLGEVTLTCERQPCPLCRHVHSALVVCHHPVGEGGACACGAEAL